MPCKCGCNDPGPDMFGRRRAVLPRPWVALPAPAPPPPYVPRGPICAHCGVERIEIMNCNLPAALCGCMGFLWFHTVDGWQRREYPAALPTTPNPQENHDTA